MLVARKNPASVARFFPATGSSFFSSIFGVEIGSKKKSSYWYQIFLSFLGTE
jgi:hypothetical protein